MQYKAIREARFLTRPNRFIALVEQEDAVVRAHVKNTGRCAELLVPGARVWLEYSANPARSTPCDLVCVEKQVSGGVRLINLDSAAPNAVAAEWLAGGGLGTLQSLKPEQTVGNSRFDFCAQYRGKPMAVEVKGCTLEESGLARFPDAPTLRGLKHVQELTDLVRQGWRCCVLFVVQMKGVHTFSPNWETQPQFGLALQQAVEAGVELYALDCCVTPQSLTADAFVPVKLQNPLL